MESSTEFLTAAECAEVDKALLTARDKFTTRVAIYALRSLKQIAQQEGSVIADLQPTQIEDWIYQDETLQAGGDREFRKFFSNLVISSIKPLNQAAQTLSVNLEQLTVAQVIAWFEQEARGRMEREKGEGKSEKYEG